MTLGRDLKALDFMKKLRAIDDMKDFGSWAQGSKCYEQLRGVDDMNNFGLYAYGSRCDEQLKAMDDTCHSLS